MSVPVVIVVAVARNGIIGIANGLPWRLSSDLKRFKALTLGQPVIMGRKTYESIGRPLPGRDNIVVTRQSGFAADGVHVAAGVRQALALGQDIAARTGAAGVAVIGGADIYAQTLAHADRLELTEVDAEPRGDAQFPAFDAALWREVAREAHAAGEKDDHAFVFVTLTRR